jgi:hypothetical protein
MNKIYLTSAVLFLAACTSPKQTPPGSSLDPNVVRSASAAVSWGAASNSPQGYVVEVSHDGGSSYTPFTTTTATSVTVTTLRVGQPSGIRVKAYNAGGNGPYSGATFIP